MCHVGCFANKANARRHSDGQGVRRSPRNHDPTTLLDPASEAARQREGIAKNDFVELRAMIVNLDLAFKRSKEQARQDCTTKGNCCKSITVQVVCLDEETRLLDSEEERRESALGDLRGYPNSLRPLCGVQATIDCKSLTWSDQ